MFLSGFFLIELVAFLRNSRLAFSIYTKSASKWCIHLVESTRPSFGKKIRFILSDRFDFHTIDDLSITVHAFASRILMSFSVDEMLLPMYLNLSTSLREPPVSGDMSFFYY